MPSPPAAAPRRGPSLAVAAALVVAMALAADAAFWVEPPGRDQGIFLTEGWLTLEGRSLYAEIWENKPPGIVWLYAFALATLGGHWLGVQVLAWLAHVAAALLLLRLASRATGRAGPGLVAAALYLAYAGGVLFGGFWGTAQPEVFMDPLVLGAVLLLLPDPAAPAAAPARWRPALAGALVGGAVLLKYSALPMAGLGLLLLAPRARPLAARAADLTRFLAGLAAVGAALVAGFALAGTLDALLDATVRFNLAYQRTLDVSAGGLVLSRLLGAPHLLLPLYALAGVAAVDALARRAAGGPGAARPADALVGAGLLAWLLAAAGVFWQGKFWDYHYHVVAAPLALAATPGALRVRDALARPLAPRAAAATAALVIVVLGVGYLRFTGDYLARHRLPERLAGAVDEPAFLATYVWDPPDYSYAESAAVAARLAAETAPDEPIFVWGYETGVYFYARRLPSSRFLYDLPLSPAFGEVHQDLLAQLLADLEARPPARFVVVTRDANMVEPVDSLTQLRGLPALSRWVEARYEPAWALGDFRVLRPRPRSAAP